MNTNSGVLRSMRRTSQTAELTELAPVSLAPAAKPMFVNLQLASAPATGELRIAWRQPLGGGVLSHLLLHEGTLYVSAMDGVLYAFAASDGKPRWQAKTGDYLFSSPVVAGDVVIVGSADGNAYAFN